MSQPRFFAPTCGSLSPGAELSLEDEEARHLRDVLRGQVGQRVELFDGGGVQCTAEVVLVSRKAVRLRLVDTPRLSPRPVPELWLAVAVPKSDRLKWLVEKATELAVDGLIPLVTERSVVKPGSGKLERMEEASIQACKQCGRDWVLRVLPLTEWAQFWATDREPHSAGETTYLLADPQGQPPTIRQLASLLTATVRRVVVVIGPEGGLTEDERQQAVEFGATPVALGRYILRVETAAIAAAAVLRPLLDEVLVSEPAE